MIGDDPQREGLIETPKRIVKSWRELFRGYHQNPEDILKKTFISPNYQDFVICKDIEFYSTCEHHFQPIVGKAHVGYLPRNEVVGLSKLARLVDCYSRRLQMQERITSQIASAIDAHLNPMGVGVIIQAKHFCMCARGVNKQHSLMTTRVLLGDLKENKDLRDEFNKLVEI